MVVEREIVYRGHLIVLLRHGTDIITETNITDAWQRLSDRNSQFDVLIIEDALPPGNNPELSSSAYGDHDRGIAFLKSPDFMRQLPVKRVVFLDTTGRYCEADAERLSQELDLPVLVLEVPFEASVLAGAVLDGKLE